MLTTERWCSITTEARDRKPTLVLPLPSFLQILVLVIILQVAISRKVQAEENLDFKIMQFKESAGRVSVFSPTFLYKKEFTPDFSIQIDGIYNSISGATPTGAPPVPVYVTTLTTVQTSGGGGGSAAPQTTTVLAPVPSYGREQEDGREGSNSERGIRVGGVNNSRHYTIMAGATQQAQPQPVSNIVAPAASGGGGGGGGAGSTQVIQTQTPAGTVIPMAHTSDQRYGLNFDVTRRINHNTLSAELSFSTEHDYQSMGLSLSDSIDMNHKNTILTGGLALTDDTVDLLATGAKEKKNSEDLMVGLTQYIDSKTIFNCNLSAGFINGYLTDQYKLVELNGNIINEKRPDNKTKEVLYLGLTRRVEDLAGTAEVGYRFYHDSYNISAQTVSLNWYQELGPKFILRPSLRFYDQSQASFYDVRFTGTPDFFSSDYRVSALNAYSYGLKLIWFTSQKFTFDIAAEHYEQQGNDGKTDERMYPSANVITVGGRVWL